MPKKVDPKTPMGQAVRRHREARFANQGELAAATNPPMNQKAISDIELGNRAPDCAEIAALEVAFGMPRGALFIEGECIDVQAVLDAGLINLPSTTLTAILTDEELPAAMRPVLRTAYEAMVPPKARARARRRAG